MRRHVVFAALLLSCDGVKADEGRDAALAVSGAEFHREDMPAEIRGPGVRSVDVKADVTAGAAGRSCTGELDTSAKAVAIGLRGDRGWWLLRADLPSAAAIDSPTFTAELGFSPLLEEGTRELVVRAIDDSGGFGAPAVKPLTVRRRGLPDGQLVINLAWDNGADLDLHVVLPNGDVLFKRNRGSFTPVPGAPPPDTIDGGYLDKDSNAGCVRDGTRAENVVFPEAPPPGRYLVRVDTFALCGEPAAHWKVQALLRGVRVGAAEGTSTEIDTRFGHGRDDGILALEIDVP